MLRFLLPLLLLLPGFALAGVDLVLVDKSVKKMYLYDGDKKVREYTIALGENPKGHKERQGDGKTPEGDYVLDYIKEDSAFYRAMHISYPNAVDSAKAGAQGVAPGGQIMIHGQRNGFGWIAHITQQYNWTNGCIAITNREMDEFLALVPVGTRIRIEW